MKSNYDKPNAGGSDEFAEDRKRRFVELVSCMARLRDLQYENKRSKSLIARAKRVVAVNLPSNVLRAAAIFVDQLYGFPPDQGSFGLPEWATARTALPENKRELLVCEGFQDMSTLEENALVVLTRDLADHGLHAGMAGIVREIRSGDDSEGICLVEFGEPEECTSKQVEVPVQVLRRPRPGDLIEHYRL